MAITRRQRQVLDFIEAYIQEHRCSPSYAEISEHFGGLSQSTIHGHVHNLERQGYLRRQFNCPRSLEVISQDVRVLPEQIAFPTAENGYRIPDGARAVHVSCLDGLFRHWAEKRAG